jgi:uncharacterized protein YcbX
MSSVASGTLRAIARWPVKALGGEWLDAAEVTLGGIAGDRRYTVVDLERGRPLSAADTPQLLRWSAMGGSPAVLRDPSGRRWDAGDAATCRALGSDVGRPVTLRRHNEGQQYFSGTVLVTVEGSLRALERELDRPVDLRRFRTNLHLDLDSAPFEEAHWRGRRLRIGEATFELREPCDRCVIAARDPETGQKWPELLRHLAHEHDLLFGIFAVPIEPVQISVGDAVDVT